MFLPSSAKSRSPSPRLTQPAPSTKAIRRFGADLTLPGFRKGKVPAKVLEKRFGDEIYARAADALVNDAIAEILDKEKLHPMSPYPV